MSHDCATASRPRACSGCGRHREPGVLGQQPHDRRDVAAHERRRRTAGPRRGRPRRPAPAASTAGCAPAAARPPRRAPAGGRSPPTRWTRGERLPASRAEKPSTSRRISAARCRGGRCWSAATNASSIASRCSYSASGAARPRRRRAGRRGRAPARRPAGGPGSGGSTRGGPAGGHVERDVRGDAVEPRARRGPALEPRQPAPRPQQRLLHRVLCVVQRPEHAVAVRQQLAVERLHEPAEGVLVAGAGGVDQSLLRQAHPRCSST